jgi:hypothetical protein
MRALDLLGKAVVVADQERRRPAATEVERIRGVDEDLVAQVLLTRLRDRVQGVGAVRRVGDELAVGGGPSERLRVLPRLARADDDVVAELA